MVKDLPTIRRTYLKGWFMIDLISIVPFKYIPGGEGLSILRIVRIIRLLKLLRVLKASNIYKQYESQISLPHSIVTLVKFTALMMILAHWIACIWIMTATLQAAGVYTWLDNFIEFYGYCSANGDCPSRSELLDNLNGLSKGQDVYAAALYWSITTITSVGYGDITPRNPDEMLIAAVLLLMSSCLWAYIIGNATTIVSTGDPAAIEHHQTMDQLNSFMRERGFPDKMRTRLRRYFQNCREIAKSVGYQQLVDRLSPDLKADVTERNVAWLKIVPFFATHKLERHFLVAVSSEVHAMVYEPRESIKFANNLRSVAKGVASREGKVLTQGTFWGEDFILIDERLKEKSDAQTLTFCEILVLERDDFFEVLESFPLEFGFVRTAIVRMAVQRGVLREARKRIAALDKESRIRMSFASSTAAFIKQMHEQDLKNSIQIKAPKTNMRRLLKEHENRLNTAFDRQEKYFAARLNELQGSMAAMVACLEKISDEVSTLKR